MKNTPFTITLQIMSDVAEISELVGKLSAGKLFASLNLRRTNRIRTIRGILAVEQITAVLNGKRV